MRVQTKQPSISMTTTSRHMIYTVTLLLVIVGGLFVYKSTAALAVIEKVRSTRAFQPRLNVLPMPGSTVQLGLFARSINYFSVILPALFFGILISGAVRVLDAPQWFSRS